MPKTLDDYLKFSKSNISDLKDLSWGHFIMGNTFLVQQVQKLECLCAFSIVELRVFSACCETTQDFEYEYFEVEEIFFCLQCILKRYGASKLPIFRAVDDETDYKINAIYSPQSDLFTIPAKHMFALLERIKEIFLNHTRHIKQARDYHQLIATGLTELSDGQTSQSLLDAIEMNQQLSAPLSA